MMWTVQGIQYLCMVMANVHVDVTAHLGHVHVAIRSYPWMRTPENDRGTEVEVRALLEPHRPAGTVLTVAMADIPFRALALAVQAAEADLAADEQYAQRLWC